MGLMMRSILKVTLLTCIFYSCKSRKSSVLDQAPKGAAASQCKFKKVTLFGVSQENRLPAESLFGRPGVDNGHIYFSEGKNGEVLALRFNPQSLDLSTADIRYLWELEKSIPAELTFYDSGTSSYGWNSISSPGSGTRQSGELFRNKISADGSLFLAYSKRKFLFFDHIHDFPKITVDEVPDTSQDLLYASPNSWGQFVSLFFVGSQKHWGMFTRENPDLSTVAEEVAFAPVIAPLTHKDRTTLSLPGDSRFDVSSDHKLLVSVRTSGNGLVFAGSAHQKGRWSSLVESTSQKPGGKEVIGELRQVSISRPSLQQPNVYYAYALTTNWVITFTINREYLEKNNPYFVEVKSLQKLKNPARWIQMYRKHSGNAEIYTYDWDQNVSVIPISLQGPLANLPSAAQVEKLSLKGCTAANTLPHQMILVGNQVALSFSDGSLYYSIP